MNVIRKHSRRTVLKTGLVTAAATALAVPEAKAQQSKAVVGSVDRPSNRRAHIRGSGIG